MSRHKYISKKEFLAVLRANAGLYARTAKAIEKQFDIKYTRQAVKIRAERYPEILVDIMEENVELAEEGIHDVMRSPDERMKYKACEFYLRTIGKYKGYVEQVETKDVSDPWVELAKKSVIKNED
jgi:hypothetical protein